MISSQSKTIKNQIVDTAVSLFNKCGFYFKMDDIARALNISKKTIYKYFDSKEEIFKEFILESFDLIHEEYHRILNDSLLSTKMKLLAILNTRGKNENKVSIDSAIEIKTVYPNLYQLILQRFSQEWENIEQLLNEGKDQGIFQKEYSNAIIQKLFLHAVQISHDKEFLKKNNITYREFISKSVSLIVEGICTIKGREQL